MGKTNTHSQLCSNERLRLLCESSVADLEASSPGSPQTLSQTESKATQEFFCKCRAAAGGGGSSRNMAETFSEEQEEQSRSQWHLNNFPPKA